MSFGYVLLTRPIDGLRFKSRSWKYLTTILAAAPSAARWGDTDAVVEVALGETDVVGGGAMLDDVVETVGLGSFAVQADVVVIAARASVATIKPLASDSAGS